MKCIKCGQEVADNAIFCNYCGNQMPNPGIADASAPDATIKPNVVQQAQEVEQLTETVPQTEPVQQAVQPASAPVEPAVPAQPVQQAVQPQPVQQPVYAQPQYQQVQYQQPVYAAPKKGLSGAQKGIIVALLLVLVGLLAFVAFGSSKLLGVHDGSRTIMIYVVGSNLESQNGIVTADLDAIDPDSIDLSKTNVLLYTGGTERWFNFVKNDENGLYILTKDGFEQLESYKQLNMGDANTLTSFLNYGYENYKTEKYDLILYDHGGAVDGAIYDDISNDNLSLDDFTKALKNSKFNEKNKMEAVLFRTCLNGTIEVANIFAPYANYLVASEEVSYGSNKTNVLSFINELDKKDSGEEFGTKFVESYEAQQKVLNPRNRVTQTYSVIDLSKIAKVNKELDNFMSGIDVEKDYKKISKVRANLFQYGSDVTDYDTVDLYQLIKEISKYSSKDADDLLEAIDDAVIYNKTNIPTSHGLSIYFPFKGRTAAKNKFLAVYNGLNYSKEYKSFIIQFNGVQTNNYSSFSISLDKNSSTTAKEGNEVSLQLTPEQIENMASARYLIVQKNKEHPNYYFSVYSSSDYTLDDNGVITTNITDNIVYVPMEGGGEHFVYMKYDKEPIETYYNAAVAYNMVDADLNDLERNPYSLAADLYYDREGNELKVSVAKIRSADERVNGTLLDLGKYSKVDIVFTERRILDEKGEVMPIEDWEKSPNINAVRLDINEETFKLRSLDTDNDYYCLFMITDVAGNVSYSKLIKVGA